ncbi:hypothetical protein GCM10011360_17530 [Primorskyibacter flagellatus]|uniref:Uncharacterized protein n=1 Tax=Primorskyibacter flagellatus TaxID=1387277 RepID=A0A917A685_9RHOB|nr:hypothetical protein [Primorskyibacter flagellatus]GGE29955.1 hypothetical protein GCM10011360_17530 [Primorskyibacter flagellatus]
MELPRRLSEPGPLIEYISELRRLPAKRKEAKELIDAIRATLRTPDGSILLDLLEKATLLRSIPITADPRALDAINAQSFIALDLRRILSDEFDAEPVVENQAVRASGRGQPRRR